MTAQFKGKTLLITGGTGSFGNAVLRHFIETEVKEIRIFSRDEKKQDDMRTALNNAKIKFYIGDVRSFDSVSDAMEGVDYVFHAAALKQVPSCEFYPIEAVRTNILGAENVIRAAALHNVSKMVVLSTDKAVYPINAMGMSKALMEKVMAANSRIFSPEKITLSATRYGNVMASRGSVIPLFLQQIKNNQPITITDPAMTRFLMSLDESVNLVLYAFSNATSGDIFVQKAPASTIADLAHAMIELFNSKSEIKIIGTRHGEKLYESLISREEMARCTDLGEYYRIPADTRDLNYNIYFNEGQKEIAEFEDYTSHNTKQLTVPEVKQTLMKLNIIREALNA
jgi:UDP-N-acetylglucosamine 4,6-dehydratase/5-epimerase